ncbi:MAG: FAD-dependent oxidoreductase [Gammaproteobacteria bacterium]|nr:FAD-dependent oxidoreductase [Gammaproteobacteria bacterium]
MTVRNRIFVPAHTTNYGADNLPTDRHLAYHRERARGGVGLIIFEAIRVHPSTLGRSQGVNGYDRAAIPRFAAIAEAVHAEGAKVFGQVIHLGRHIDGNFARMPAWGASPIPWTITAPPPHPMSVGEIAEVVAAHATVASNLVEAGLDGIELTMAHGHLLQQFLSPLSNQRTDAYGGNEENRLRFTVEALTAVRRAIGTRATLGLRISADEFVEGGLTLSDMQRIMPRLLATAPIDFLNVSHSAYHGSRSISTQMADMAFPRDAFHHLPRGIADAVAQAGHETPVFAVCGFGTVAQADAMLADPRIAMVGMARAHMADPHLVRKAAEGREREQRPCVRCNQGCAGFLAISQPITCLTNPGMGREREWTVEVPRAALAKRVVVIGGGPGGMEAAIMASRRGHTVTLVEAEAELGGRLQYPAALPLRHDFADYLAFQRRELARLAVEVRLKTRVNADVISSMKADAVIVATGAAPRALTFPEGGAGLTLEAALDPAARLGKRIAIVDVLGHWAVAATAEHLARAGHAVTLISPSGPPGWLINIYSSFAWRHRLRERKVAIRAQQSVLAFVDGRTTLLDGATGERTVTDAFDTIIAPTHGVPNDDLMTTLTGRCGTLVAIGDAQSPRTALEAVFEGHEAAWCL